MTAMPVRAALRSSGAMPEAVEWLGLSAVYSDRELRVMADLRSGVSAGEVSRVELEVLHELKSLLVARIIESVSS